MGTTGHFCHSLAEEVGGNQGGCEAMVGGAISQLAVTIVPPRKHLSICMGTASGKPLMLSQWLMFYVQIRRSGGLFLVDINRF